MTGPHGPHRIRLIGGEAEEHATFTQHYDGKYCLLSCTWRDREFAAEAGDFFEALVRIRRQLEGHGLRPWCYGASRNIYPSAMARDMGLGRKAYHLTLGQHAVGASVVRIFDEGPDIDPASPDDQIAFWETWKNSLPTL